MSYLEELLPEFRKGAKIRRREWPENLCISLRNSCGLNIPYQDVEANDWEFVKDQEPEPIDWDYIIKNKCLCWFWDEGKERHIMSFLKSIVTKEEPKFFDKYGVMWDNCRPVRRDEVTFYEDRKDVAKG